jgi:hypothetical protein
MVLIGIIYHKKKRYCIPRLLDWLEQADLTDCDVLMRWHLGEYSEPDAVKKQRQYFRTLTLQQGYSHLYFIDCDTIPPLDVIPRLLARHKDIIGAVYNSRHAQSQTYKGQKVPLAWRDTPDPYGYLNEGELVEVDGMGMGAVLLSKNALEDAVFDAHKGDQDDWPVYRLLASKGHKIYLDQSLICKHYETKDTYI